MSTAKMDRPRTPSTASMQFAHVFTKEHPGKIDDFYTLDSALMGEGSYGRVCRCVNKSTNAERAVKAIDISKIKNISRFEQEIQIQQSLDHPNIVKLHEVIVDAKKYYLVMELCTGGELFDRIVAESEKHDGAHAFGEAGARIYMQQILGAMNYLHQSNFVHRDIKPENFLLQTKAKDAEIKVIDFGLATRFQAGGEPTMKTKAGTPYYVAPEVLATKYDEKCDIWSCGVIMYIILSGYPPFFGDTDKDILRMVSRGKFDFPSPDWDHISAAAKMFIGDMLTLDAKKRPSAAALLSHEWIRTDPCKGAITKDLGHRLKKFLGSTKLKKAALSVIAKQLKDEDVQELRRTFQALDVNKDGMLTHQEVHEGMKKQGLSLPGDLEATLLGLDTDGSGMIDYTEFIASTMTAKQYLKRDVMWAAFRVFDQDGDGSITGAELTKVLQLMDDSIQVQMITEADVNGDGNIDFEEFCKMLQKDT